jgi:hypothetical protein
VDAPLPVRTDSYEIGTPLSCFVENGLRYFSNLDFGLYRKYRFAQFARSPLDQCASWLLLVFQLGSVILRDLRRRHGLNSLQHV